MPAIAVAIDAPIATRGSIRRCVTNASIVRPSGGSVILARPRRERLLDAGSHTSMNFELTVAVHGQGLYDVTHKVAASVRNSGIDDGLATVFIRHTSASLIIQ